MRVTKVTKNLSVSLDEETYHKIKEMTSVRGISMTAWIRRLIDEELQHLSFEEDSIESDVQEEVEDEQWSSESPSNNNEEFDLRKLVLGDDDTTEKVDEIE